MNMFISVNPVLPKVLLIWCIVFSIILFGMMGADKARAIKGKRRIPEKRLFLLAFLGGAAGGWAGMYAFRHKTKHTKFVICFPLISIIQTVGLIYLFICAYI